EVEAALDAVIAGHELPPPRPHAAGRRWKRIAVAALTVAACLALVALLLRSVASHSPLSPPALPEPAAVTGTPPTAGNLPVTPPTPSPAATPSPEPGETAAPALPSTPQARPERPAPVEVQLRSTPPGARVTLHGRLLGLTPLSVRLPPDRTVL